MPVIEWPSGEEVPDVPVVDLPEEKLMQRELTAAFIAADPSTIVLVAHSEITTPTGGRRAGPGVPRDAQIFKLISMSYTERPAKATGVGNTWGVQRKYDFTLLGTWDAIVAKGDYWDDTNGQRWVVDAVSPYNGYEVKALVMSYGEDADHSGG